MHNTNYNKVLVVLNPISGGIDKKTADELLGIMAKTYNVEQEIFRTTGENDLKNLKKKIKDFKPELIIAGGGDGTINLTAKAILKTELPMGILPLGSANGLATELQIPSNLEDAYEIAVEGDTIDIDVLEVNKKYISLHLSDIGFNANLVKRFEAEEQRGKMAYAKQFFKEYFSSKSSRFYFELNGNKFSKRAVMVVFANATMYGTGAIINPKGELNDGKFEVCIIKPYPWYAIFGMAASFFFGNLHESRYVRIISTKNITVRGRKAQTIQVDGEIIGSFKKIHARVIEDKVKVIKPADY
ncbi:MAG: diacylglycerol/lipid kinase family protein [Candidatus Cyclobacteriaceae bacterium M2_1C_046]